MQEVQWASKRLVSNLVHEEKYELAAYAVLGAKAVFDMYSKLISDTVAKSHGSSEKMRRRDLEFIIEQAKEEIKVHRKWQEEVLSSLPRKKSVMILINFINDLLDFQKLDEGKVKLEKTHCSINSIIKESISLVRETARAKNIEIDYCPTDYEVFCDEVKLSQTVLNLLTNAIKFSPPESSVQVKVDQFEKEGAENSGGAGSVFWFEIPTSDFS